MTESPPEAAIGPLQKILDANPNRIPQRALRTPAKEFFILFTARTGSSHLAELLTSARVGDVREWLNPAFVEGQARYFGASTLAEYFSRIRSACPDGVFGQKMTIWFYEAFSRETQLEEHFDFAAPCVFLFRESLVDQAVSLRLAQQRNVFHRREDVELGPLSPVDYDATAIMQIAEALLQEESRLRAFMQAHGTQPRYLSYERLISADPAAIVDAVARMIDVKPARQSIRSRHRKLGDVVNIEHVRRFTQEQPQFCENLQQRRQWLIAAAQRSPLV